MCFVIVVNDTEYPMEHQFFIDFHKAMPSIYKHELRMFFLIGQKVFDRNSESSSSSLYECEHWRSTRINLTRYASYFHSCVSSINMVLFVSSVGLLSKPRDYA